MKKEKHPIYGLMMTALVLLLLLGIALLAMGIALGPDRIFASPAVTL